MDRKSTRKEGNDVVKYWENVLGRCEELRERVRRCGGGTPVIDKYAGVLALADVLTTSTAFWVMESVRLDLGFASQVDS